MGFWIYMLIMDLIIPATMIGFGKYFIEKAPKEINAVFGYRTSMSMKNMDTWKFAHQYFGKIWHICGWIILPLSVIGMLPFIGQNTDVTGTAGAVILGIQMVLLIAPIVPTEYALRKKFDRTGKRK